MNAQRYPFILHFNLHLLLNNMEESECVEYIYELNQLLIIVCHYIRPDIFEEQSLFFGLSFETFIPAERWTKFEHQAGKVGGFDIACCMWVVAGPGISVPL